MSTFNNLKIGTKLIVGFILVAIIAGIVGAVGIINLQTTTKEYNELYEEYGIPIADIARASIEFQQIRVGTRNIVLAETTQERETIAAQLEGYHKNIEDYLLIFNDSLQTDVGRQSSQRLETALNDYYVLEDKIVESAMKGNMEDAKNILFADSSAEVVKAVLAEIDILFNLKSDTGKALAITYSEESNRTILTVTLIVVAAVVIAILLGFLLSRMISKPVVHMVGVAEKVADGYLDVEINSNSKDEIGLLAGAFQKMTDNLNDVMFHISMASEQVSSGATQLSDSSMELASGATQQASAIEELSASIEEISSQTKLNAENAKNANSITSAAKVSAVEGNQRMLEMLKAMEEINDASANISRIIKVIDDIAFQTNILALNAAVEAARAGQHGKGFAVVAEEVRNLAARSANAAKETTAMIEGSVKKVEGGTKIAQETADALEKIVRGITEVAELIGHINVASNEQALGIEQINQGIMQVSTVVQTNSATSEESAAASEELASQAVLLEEQVSKFKLKKGMQSTYVERREEPKKKPAGEKTGGSKKGKKIILSDQDFGKY
jgi:methyl-accepting chemotaxis protein